VVSIPSDPNDRGRGKLVNSAAVSAGLTVIVENSSFRAVSTDRSALITTS